MTLKPKNYVPTPYDLERIEVCPASRVFVGPREKPNAAMWHGIFVHRFLEYAQTRGRDAALAYIRKKNKKIAEKCARINVDSIPPGSVEPKYLLDPWAREGREIFSHSDADENVHFYAGADLVAPIGGGYHVIDFKSGEPENHIGADKSVQLALIAAAVYLETGVSPLRVSIVAVPSDGVLGWANTYVMHKLELQDFIVRLRRAHSQLTETRAEYHEESVKPAFVPGSHCFGCRARLACPATKK